METSNKNTAGLSKARLHFTQMMFPTYLATIRRFAKFNDIGVPDDESMTALMIRHNEMLMAARKAELDMRIQGADPDQLSVYEHASWVLQYGLWDFVDHINLQLKKKRIVPWVARTAGEKQRFGISLNAIARALRIHDIRKDTLLPFRENPNFKPLRPRKVRRTQVAVK